MNSLFSTPFFEFRKFSLGLSTASIAIPMTRESAGGLPSEGGRVPSEDGRGLGSEAS